MVVNDFNILGTILAPTEAESPLLVNSNAVLPFSVARQSFESITRERSQILQVRCAIKDLKAPSKLLGDTSKLPHIFTSKKSFRIFIVEAAYHAMPDTRYVSRIIYASRSKIKSAMIRERFKMLGDGQPTYQ